MKYAKHLLILGMGETQTESGDTSSAVVLDIGNDFSFEEDLDKIFVSMTFKLPYINLDNFDTRKIQKYDVCRLYFKFFDSETLSSTATKDDLILVFDGYIDRKEINENKIDGTSYTIYANSTMGLAGERTMTIKSFEGNVQTLFNHADGYVDSDSGVEYGVDLKSFVPLDKRDIDDFAEAFVLKITPDVFFTKTLESIHEKYAIHCYQSADGILHVKRPVYFSDEITVYDYDLKENIFNIDYGDLTQKYDSVIVMGSGCSGWSFDPIAYQLKQGAKNSTLTRVSNIDIKKLNPLLMYRRDIQGPEQCQEVAKNKLVELAKNNTITLNVEFNPEQKIGESLRIKNSTVINPDQIWIIKNRNITIGKDNITSTLTAYSNAIIDFPESDLTPPTGLLDIDVLNTAKEVVSISTPL